MKPQELAAAESQPESRITDATAPLVATKECPFCRKLNPAQNQSCEVCATPLPGDDAAASDSREPATVADAPVSSNSLFGGRSLPTSGGTSPYFADVAPSKSDGRTVLIAVGILLLGAIAFVLWMMHPLSFRTGTSAASDITVTITPNSADVPAGLATDLVATVSGTAKPDVVWRVQEGDQGGRVVSRGVDVKNGQVSFPAVYVAPAAPGTYHVVVSGKADPSKNATATMTVTAR